MKKILPDGRRLYDNGQTYTPVSPDERVYAVRKPNDPRAVRWHGQWFLPLDTVPDAEREMPETQGHLVRTPRS